MCDRGPNSVDFRFIKRKILLGGYDILNWYPFKRGHNLP